jgi:hypothetical protein
MRVKGNALDDLGFSPEKATLLKFKADLYSAIRHRARRYSPKQLMVILGRAAAASQRTPQWQNRQQERR